MQNSKIVESVANDLERDEGFVPHVYLDSEGWQTIGIGTMVDKRLKGGLTYDEAKYILINRINQTEAWLSRKYEWFNRLSDNRKKVMINMGFALGEHKFAGFGKMIRAMEIGHFDRAAVELLDSKWARKLGKRAQRLYVLLRAG